MKLVLLGPPGAGKGTLAKPLSAEYNIPDVSSGDLFRNEIAGGSTLGRQLKENCGG
jgi:adenylate kinase